MKKVNSKYLTLSIIFLIIVISIIVIVYRGGNADTPEGVAKCIGEKSTVYVQLGCHACESQEDLFGDNYQYLNVVDCYFNRDKCGEITATPSTTDSG